MNLLFSPSGRIGRLAWWGGQIAVVGVLFLISIVLVMAFSFVAAGIEFDVSAPEADYTPSGGAQVISVLSYLALSALAFWMTFCVTVKRYHDRDKSGWWYLIAFVPLVGVIWQIVECGFLRGDGGVNSYGPPGGGGFSGGSLDDEIEALRRQRRAADNFESSSARTAQAATVTRAARGHTGVPSAGTKPAFGRR
jgi:uncharacterized membrane protein YhaH (DUF805 family)